MRPYSPLKKRVKYKLVPVRLNTSFRTVLKCYQVFSDTLLTDSEKVEACLWLLVKSKLFLKILKPDKKAALFNLIFKEFIDVSDKKPEEKSISILIRTHGPSILPLCSATISICSALTKIFIGGALRRYLTVCLMIRRSCRSFQYVPAHFPSRQNTTLRNAGS